MSIIAGTAIESALGNYQIERSLRFNSADSAYLSRTFTTPTNSQKFTFSGWVKRSKLDSSGLQGIFAPYSSGTVYGYIAFYQDGIRIYDRLSAGTNYLLQTTAVYRDVSSWYHIVCSIDTTQATASNRVRLYLNGVEVTSFSTSTYPTQNNSTSSNSAIPCNIGYDPSNTGYLNGYLTEINFIDGQALDPTSFGEYNSDTGVWQPKAYTGSYGTNGFYLNFSDNSGTTSTTLGKDYSGNGNNWTPNNFSVTAGTGNDSLVDTPTPYGTDTGVGGEVRGNYCTFNPNLYNAGSVTYTNGNLLMTMTGNADRFNLGTIAVPSGKWYWEFTPNGFGNSSDVTFGICKASRVANGPWVAYGGPDTINFNTGNGWSVYGSNVGGATGSIAGNDVIGIALDMDSNYIYIYKNGTLLTSRSGSITTSVPHTLFIDTYASGSTAYLNTGQRPFAYTAPSGYKAICTTNLPDPTIADGGEYFNAVLYAGTSPSTNSVTGVGFQPDLVWVKSRTSGVRWHENYDVLRPDKKLSSNATDAEYTETMTFNADGFTTSGGVGPNETGNNYVGWCWKASNASGVTNTAGTITSTVSANTTSGFSIVTYTATRTSAGNDTIGHGIGIAPAMVISKARNTTTVWIAQHSSLGTDQYLELNTTSGARNSSSLGGGALPKPTSTVFYGSWLNGLNVNGQTIVAYCFAPVAGYSAFGSYTGNGSTDGPFVYTGFRPAYVLVKLSSTSGEGWWVHDFVRPAYNATTGTLRPNDSTAEENLYPFDLLSNGFKIRESSNRMNYSGQTFIYAAFAENPFKYALAR